MFIIVPAPVVSTLGPLTPHYAGGLDDVTLTCSASLNMDEIDRGDENILYTFTWMERGGDTIVSGGRTTISTTTSPTTSSLTLSPLSTTDTNFTCTVRATEEQARLEASELGRNTIQVNILSEFQYGTASWHNPHDTAPVVLYLLPQLLVV